MNSFELLNLKYVKEKTKVTWLKLTDNSSVLGRVKSPKKLSLLS